MITRDKSQVVDPLVVIADLERQQQRAMREAVLTGNSKRLQDIEDDIVWLCDTFQLRKAG